MEEAARQQEWEKEALLHGMPEDAGLMVQEGTLGKGHQVSESQEELRFGLGAKHQ